MDDYIKLKAALEECDWYANEFCECEYAIMPLKGALENLPAADVRPVVLCRDCKFAPSGTDDGEDQGFALEWPHDEWPEDNPCPCKCADGWYSHKPAPDFFCAAGEKREG